MDNQDEAGTLFREALCTVSDRQYQTLRWIVSALTGAVMVEVAGWAWSVGAILMLGVIRWGRDRHELRTVMLALSRAGASREWFDEQAEGVAGRDPRKEI